MGRTVHTRTARTQVACGMSALTFDEARALAVYADEPDICIVCGEEPTVLGLYLQTSDDTLVSLAWCDLPACVADRELPVYLGITIQKRIN